MPDVTTFLLNCGSLLWNFMKNGWFPCAILFVKFVLPKLIDVFKRSVGR